MSANLGETYGTGLNRPNSGAECADAIDLLHQLGRRPLHAIAAAAFPNGNAA